MPREGNCSILWQAWRNSLWLWMYPREQFLIGQGYSKIRSELQNVLPQVNVSQELQVITISYINAPWSSSSNGLKCSMIAWNITKSFTEYIFEKPTLNAQSENLVKVVEKYLTDEQWNGQKMKAMNREVTCPICIITQYQHFGSEPSFIFSQFTSTVDDYK